MKLKPKSKINIDPAPQGKPFMSKDHEYGYTATPDSLPNFEKRYLNNVMNVDQFQHAIQYGKNIEWLEKHGYKLFNFIQRRGEFKLFRLVSDWVKDPNGTVWLIGVKSFTISKAKFKKPK